MRIIYEKETRRVLITEQDGIWTFPNEWDLVIENAEEEPLVYDEQGDAYLKAERKS